MPEKVRTILVSAPEIEPVSVPELRDHARVSTDDADSMLDALIYTARIHLEQVSGRAFIKQTLAGYLMNFHSPITLPRPPLIGVQRIEYVDPDNNSQTLDPSIYVVDAVSDPGKIYLADGKSWPAIAKDPNAIKILYDAGYGSESWQVPAQFRQAINILATTLYDNPSITGQRDASKMVEAIYMNLVSADRNFVN